jgi:hypothetical protein
MVSLDSVLEAQAPVQGTSVQKAALTCALLLAAKKTVNVYTDSNYAFITLHVLIYKERGLITSEGRHKVWVGDS